MAPLGVIESQDTRATQPTTDAMEGAANRSPPLEDAGEGAVLEAPEASETTENGAETTVATSTETSGAAMAHHDDAAQEEEIEGGEEDLVVNLKFLHRERVTLQCPAAIAVAVLKQRVRDAYIHAVQQDQAASGGSAQQDIEPAPATQPLRLIYKGKVLKDDQTLAAYNFLGGDTIHAVFSRAAPVATAAPAPAAEETPAPARASTNTTDDAPHADDDDDDDDNSDGEDSGLEMRFTRFEMPPGADIGQIISSVLTSALNAPDGEASTTPTIIFPWTGAAASTSAPTASASPTPPTPPPASVATPQRGATVAPASSSTPASAPQPARPAETSRPPTALRPPTAPSGSSLLLNDAAALRRSIPALELAPLARPPQLSMEMYNLGNAIREAGDTYLAIHRQLQFVATRFLQENHLTAVERERLRSRVQQLVPVLERLSSLSTGISQQLASSPYGHADAGTAPPSQAQGSQGQSAPVAPSTSTQASALPLASPVSDLLSSLVQMASGSQQSTAEPSTAASQVMRALPNLLGIVAAMAGGGQPAGAGASVGSFTSTPATQAQGSNAAPAASEPPIESLSFAPISAFPLWSLGYKLQQHLASRPDYLSLSFDEFVGVICSLVMDHIARCCASGTDQFIRTATDEVGKIFKEVEQIHGRVYSRAESRCGVIRVALQELAQLCQDAIHDVDEARNTKMRSWLRRSCSHLFVEVSEEMDPRNALKTVAEVVAHLVAGSAMPRTPVHEAVVARTHQYLASRFLLA